MSRRPRSLENSDVKFGWNQSDRVPPHQQPLRPIEWAVLLHIGSMAALGTWAFGSGADWVRTSLACWGSVSLLLLLTFVRDRENWANRGLRPLRWLWPLAGLNVLTLIACLSP